jgi:protein-disulfide isomerase
MGLEDRIKYARMKARHKKQIKPWYFKSWGIFSLLIIALSLSFIIASSIYIVKAAKEHRKQELIEGLKRQYIRFEQAVEGDINNINFGPENAPLTVVLFTDFACPICAQTAPIVLDLKENYKNNLKFIHRDFPTQENSINLSLAAHCANDQEAFWNYYEELFSQQERFQNLYDEDLLIELTQLSTELNLDPNNFAQCLNEQKHISIIANDFQDLEYLRLAGSPIWFINNHKIEGYIAPDKFILLINELLTEFYD